MPTEKLVDADFLGRLLAGSMEAKLGAVDEAVSASASLFGGDEDVRVETVATFTDHTIVANSEGEFYRCEWRMTEDGIELGEVKPIDVPVFESNRLTLQARNKSREVVEAMLSGDPGLDEKLGDLAQLAFSGPRLTAEGVEDYWSEQVFTESDWFVATREQESAMRAFIGAEVNRLDVPKPYFGEMIEADLTESQEEGHRASVLSKLTRLAGATAKLADRIELAAEIDESYEVRGGGAMAATEFVEFVESYTDDLEVLGNVISDAAALAEDGCVKCLARLHDAVAGQMYEWALAGAFIEKLARRFEAPQAA